MYVLSFMYVCLKWHPSFLRIRKCMCVCTMCMSHLLRNRFNVLIQEQNYFFFHFLYCAHEVFRQSLAVTYVCMQVSGPINTSSCMYVFVYMYVCMYVRIASWTRLSCFQRIDSIWNEVDERF